MFFFFQESSAHSHERLARNIAGSDRPIPTKRGKRSLSDFSKSILYRKRWCCSTRPLVTVHVPFSSFHQRPSLPTSISSPPPSLSLSLLLPWPSSRYPVCTTFARVLLFSALCTAVKTCEAVKLERFVSRALRFDIKFSSINSIDNLTIY